MTTATLPEGKSAEDHNPGQDEFDKLIERNFSPGDERAMEERAKDGAIDDNTAANENSTSTGAEANETQQLGHHANQVGRGYLGRGSLAGKRGFNFRKTLLTRRGALVGGGTSGLIIALFSFFIFQGPLEYAHIAQLLQQFHFQAQQDQSDDRMSKLARYIRYKGTGKLYRTNLGLFQNFIADKIETRMNDAGIESAYNNSTFGFSQDGYVMDPSKLSASEFEDFKGKTPAEIKQYFKDNFNVDISFTDPATGKDFTNGKFFVDTSNINSDIFGHNDLVKLNKLIMKTTGFSSKTGSLAARIMAKRAGSTWHPLTRAKTIAQGNLAERIKTWAKDRFQNIETGDETITASNKTDSQRDPTGAQQAQNEADGANTAGSDGQQARNGLSTGDTTSIDKLKASIKANLTPGSALAATGWLCTFKGLDDASARIKEAQVALPLLREGIEAMGIGNQDMSNQDLTTEQLGYYKNLLDGPSTYSNGKTTSWIEADSIQAELGHTPSNGVGRPSQTLMTINAFSPFHFLNQGTLGSVMAPVCSEAGQALQIAVGFFGGDIEGQLLSLAIGQIVGGPLLDDAARWLAGAAIDPNAAGADYGNAINFGARLAANAQALSSGGRMLSSNESTQLALYENNQSQQDFASHSIAYQLFNPYDERSAIAKIIDTQSPNVSQDITNTATALLNVGHLFTFLPKLFSATAHAAPQPYNYGFPEYGYSVDEMNNPAVKNPYKNADDVINNILPNHPEYIDWAKKCFGVTIDPTSFDVTSLGTDKIDPTSPDPSQQNFYSDQDPNGCSTSVTTAAAPAQNKLATANKTKAKIITVAAPTPSSYFNVQGSSIMHSGNEFIPYGISIVTDLAQSNWKSFPQQTDAQIQAAAKYWHSNAIRIQVSEQNFIGDPNGAAAMQRLGQEIDEIESLGMVPIISDNTERTNASQQGPTSRTVDFWNAVTSYLSGNGGSKYSNVIFDVFNEAATNGSVWQQGGTYNGTKYLGMQDVVNAIRSSSNPLKDNLIFVEAPKGASDLSELDQYPIHGSNLAFSYHHVDFTQPTATWESKIGLNLKTKVPIVDGEWTQYASTRTYECYDGAPKYISNYLDVLHQNHIGLIFWSLEPGVGTLTTNSYPVSDFVNSNFSTTPADYSQPTTFKSDYSCTTQNGQPDGNLIGQGAGADIMDYFSKYSIPPASPNPSPSPTPQPTPPAPPPTSGDCTNNYSDACNKLKVRFYIFDTQTMEGATCYLGDSGDSQTQQACTNMGLNDSSQNSSGSTTTAGTLPTGSAQQLAQQLLPYIQQGDIKCNGQAANCPDIQNTATGTSIKSGGCQVDALNAGLVGMLLELVKMGHTFVISALCSDHSNDGMSGHAGGRAVDFNYIDGVFMGPNDVPWDSTKIAAAEKLDDDIASFMPKSTGFGQIQCHANDPFPFQASWPPSSLFPDLCHHQHVQVETP